ncbi:MULTISPECIES: sulfite exporter TauE/SafE family protein [unclassified Sphaerochaeta]|uniref:sulfite exporter TauE/SafE family protein n=1 Tax=unclassified Sphaerochaeta TaxID=2637943 RepID=UPI0025F16066|nr:MULTISPECIES: sulfite exporter TauE/SafE family protein [unclassified Sphaerochaeta]MDX9825218.1 sulfite exporter TauE/SafE family protein [Sphaerochaeta sp.]
MSAVLASGVVVLITHALEAVTGFGCAVLAMPFVSALLGVKTAVKVITILAWLLALYLAVRNVRRIDFKQYAVITACMLAGLPFGMYLFRSQDTSSLSMILAVFIVLVSVSQLYRLVRKQEQGGIPQGKRALPYYALLVLGGVVHGLFSSGGPLVVLYATRALPDKGSFRATLCLLWATLNTIIIATYLGEGSLDQNTLKTTALLIPFIVAGVVIGERVHNKVDERKFSLIVFSMLLLTGIFMLIGTR